MKKINVLVTGGAGFIGSHVADELVAKGYNVVVLDDLTGGFKANVNPKATFVKGTVTDVKLIDSLFNKYSFTYVYHLAAYAAEGLSHFIRRFNYNNNLVGSINLINASVRHKVKCFVFASSIAVYGPAQFPMHEDTAPIPEDPYGIAKYAVELDLKAAHEMFGLDSIIFRPHNVYGERQNIGDKYRNVLGIFMNNVLKGEPMPIFGDGKQKRAFTHIADIAPVIARSVDVKKAYNKVFNIGADTPYTVKELATIVGKAMGEEKPNIKYLPARKEVKMAYADHSLSRKVFGIKKAPITLEEGVQRMADWVKKEGAKKSSTFKGIEITENLPPSWR
jgi:UDP-glucose 4-epimerase